MDTDRKSTAWSAALFKTAGNLERTPAFRRTIFGRRDALKHGTRNAKRGSKCMSRLFTACLVQLATLAMLSSVAIAQSQPSSEDLELAFNGHCRECHSFVKNDNRLGPSLYGVVGRKAGSVANFAYSDALKRSGITWDEKTLDKWIKKPNALIPNNNMGTLFSGLPDAKERAKIIAFLKQDTNPALGQPKQAGATPSK